MIVGTITVVFTTERFQGMLEAKNFLSSYTEHIISTKHVIGLDKDSMADNKIIALKNSNGSITSYGFSEPVTFKDESGQLRAKEISIIKQKNKILKEKGFDYTNGDNDYRVNISSDIRNGVNTEFNKAAFTMIPNVSAKEEKTNISTAQAGMLHISPIMAGVSPIKLSVSGQVVENKKDDIVSFQYDEAYGEGTYLSIEPQLNGVNQKIVLSRTEDVSNISFTIVSENCTPVIQEDGCIQLVNNESKQVTQVIETPVISTEDLESDFVIGDVFGRGSYTLNENEDGSHSLGITVPEGMNMDISEYGDLVVTVPVIAATNATGTTTGHISPALDTGIYTGTPSTCYNNEVLSCFGRDSGYGYGRALTHFTKPAAITLGATIHYAFFWARECTGETSSTYVQPYIVNDTWNSQTTWATRPGFMSTTTMTRKNINSASTDMSGNPYWYKFSIYQAVNAWVKGVKPNRGIIFRSEEETNHNYRWRAFATKEYTTSSMRPYTVINYTNDTAGPTYTRIDQSPQANQWTNTNVTLSVVGAEDSGAGLHAEPYSFSTVQSTKAWQAGNTKTYSINTPVYITLRDKLTNPTSLPLLTINNIDKLKPAVPSVTVSQSNWSQSAISITVQSEDSAATTQYGKSGVKYYSCTTTAGQYDWKAVSTLNSNYTFHNVSYGTYYIYAKDQAGNISNAATATALVDLENPAVNGVEVKTNAVSNTSIVHIVASDITSGISAYSLNGGQSWTEVNPSTNNLNTDVNTTLNSDSIDVRVKDVSGRVSVPLAKPEFYDYNGLVGIFNPNLNGESIEYRFEGDEDWTTYEKPIEIEQSQTIYAKLENGSHTIYNQFTPAAENSQIYTETQTDLTITNNQLSFDISREYNSDDNDWRFSTETSAQLTHNNNIIEITMPSGSKMYFVKTAQNTYFEQLTEYTLNETDDCYVFNADGEIYTYNKSNGRLADISDAFEHHITFAYNLADELVSITATAGNEQHQYTVSEVDGKIRHITTPITDSNNVHEKLVYQYTTDGLVKVYYDKDTLQFKRSDDIIKNEYGYTNDKLTLADGNTVNYDNEGQYLSLTTPAGETIENDGESVSTEPEQQTNVELEQEELDFTSEYPIFYSGTEIVHYEKTGYMLDGTAYITKNEYNTDSQLIVVTETHIADYGTANAEIIYTNVNEYSYHNNSDIIHTETVTEVDGNTTTTTVSTYNISSQLISVTQTRTKTNGVGGTDEVYSRNVAYTYFENTDTVHTETVTETADSTTSTTVITYNTMSSIVSEAVSENGKTTETAYTYDVWGNVLTSVTTVTENGVPAPVSSTAFVYDALNRCIKETVSEPNSDPVVTHRAYNPLGDVIFEKSGNDVTRTIYDKYGRAIQEIEPIDYSASADGIAISENTVSGDDTYSDSFVGHRYVYNQTTRLLTSEINRLGVETAYTYHANSSVVASESFDVYVLSYNQDGKITASTVNGNTYATYTYNDDGNPTSVIYGNGQSIHYVYDQNTGNLINQYHNNDENNPYVVYEYVPAPDETLIDTGENLELEENLEVETNEDYIIKYKTNYDSNLYYTYYNSGNVTVAKADAQNTVIYSYNTQEDEDNSSTTVTGVVGNKAYSVISNDSGIVNTFDGASLSSETAANNSNETVLKVNDSTVFTVTQTESGTSNAKSYGTNLTFTDTFAGADKLQISSSSDGSDTTSYTYYADGQLHTVSGTNYSASYAYNARGNLTEKTVNNLTTSYTYSGDRLTAVGNTALTYDSIGNVLTYGNKSFTWSSGRNLASITEGESSYSYAYNKYGYRTSKTVNGLTTDFNVAEDGTVVSQTDGTNTFFFEYSEGNTPLGFVLNGTQYIYITNNSSDVMAIADSSGNIIATYSYNEWGVPTVSAAGEQNIAIANLNPLRYRGYYYDAETGYYYLRSRYYDPEICRFINADLPEYAKEQKDILIIGCNNYVYCYNSPMNYIDPYGQSPLYILLLIKAGLSVLAYVNFLCVRLFVWGFTHRSKNQIYDFSSNWKLKIKSRVSNSTGLKGEVNKLINKIKNKKVGSKVSIINKKMKFYDYRKNTSDLDLIFSIGGGTFNIFVKKTNIKENGKRKYWVRCVLKNEYYNFENWLTDGSNSNKMIDKLLNAVGFFTQNYGPFIPYWYDFYVDYYVLGGGT